MDFWLLYISFVPSSLIVYHCELVVIFSDNLWIVFLICVLALPVGFILSCVSMMIDILLLPGVGFPYTLLI